MVGQAAGSSERSVVDGLHRGEERGGDARGGRSRAGSVAVAPCVAEMDHGDQDRSQAAEEVVELLAACPSALARLGQLLRVSPAAYTVDSLAQAVGVSAKAVRNAISRGELAAVKRGGRWIISAEAVERWSTPQHVARFVRASRRPRQGPLADALSRLECEVSSAAVAG